MFKAAIRVNKIKTIAQLRGLTHHAERADEVGCARVREGAVAGDALAWSKAEGDRDYVAAFKAHKAELGAGERKNAPIAMQALCVVSPEWVQQAGDLHDRANPRNVALFDQAKAWAESWAGKGAVFGVRLDLDEKGGAVVDLMIAPVRDSRGKPVISTQKPLTELKGATGERNEYSALQTSWADWCAANLDAKIERGLRRELTAREHLSPETYGMVMDKAREAVQRPAESLLGVLRAAEVSGDDADELREYLLLKGEISRHKQDPHGYKPPKGAISTMDAEMATRKGATRWPLINALRSGAHSVVEAAYEYGMGPEDLAKRNGHENGRRWFPALADRLHLGAVIAKCARFCAYAEALMVNMAITDRSKHHAIDEFWPQKSSELVERYNRHLGLDIPQHVKPAHERKTAVVRETPEPVVEEKSHSRGHEDDWGH